VIEGCHRSSKFEVVEGSNRVRSSRGSYVSFPSLLFVFSSACSERK
jgi:hypothetical protein